MRMPVGDATGPIAQVLRRGWGARLVIVSTVCVTSASLIPAGITVATRYLDLAGAFSCALLGGAVARTVGLDLFGCLLVGIISGLGGGMIRDVLLQHGTPVALTDHAYLPTAVAGVMVAFLIELSEKSWSWLFTALDAAVIGFWAITGVNKTLTVGLGWLPAVLLGTVTAVGSGALCDVVLGRVPPSSAVSVCTPPSSLRSPESRDLRVPRCAGDRRLPGRRPGSGLPELGLREHRTRTSSSPTASGPGTGAVASGAVTVAAAYAVQYFGARRVVLRIGAGAAPSAAVARSTGCRPATDEPVARETKRRWVLLGAWCQGNGGPAS